MSKEIETKDQRSSKEVGARLRKLRKEETVLTCDGLAQELNVAESLIQKVETGKNALSRDLAIEYHDYFGVSLDYLFLGVESDQISDFLGIFREFPREKKIEVMKQEMDFF